MVFGTSVQIDEKIFNLKCKSCRGGSLTNRTDALAIFEIKNDIFQKAFATIIPKKTKETLVNVMLAKLIPRA